MRQKDFEAELGRRLWENARLSQRQFVPATLMPVAAWAAGHLFWAVVGLALLINGVSFWLWGTTMMKLSRLMLLL